MILNTHIHENNLRIDQLCVSGTGSFVKLQLVCLSGLHSSEGSTWAGDPLQTDCSHTLKSVLAVSRSLKALHIVLFVEL